MLRHKIEPFVIGRDENIDVPCRHCGKMWSKSQWHQADFREKDSYLDKYGYLCGECLLMLEDLEPIRQGRLFRKSSKQPGNGV